MLFEEYMDSAADLVVRTSLTWYFPLKLTSVWVGRCTNGLRHKCAHMLWTVVSPHRCDIGFCEILATYVNVMTAIILLVLLSVAEAWGRSSYRRPLNVHSLSIEYSRLRRPVIRSRYVSVAQLSGRATTCARYFRSIRLWPTSRRTVTPGCLT